MFPKTFLVIISPRTDSIITSWMFGGGKRAITASLVISTRRSALWAATEDQSHVISFLSKKIKVLFVKLKKRKAQCGGGGVQTKTSRLIFPFDKNRVGIFPYLNIYSPVASAWVRVRIFQNDWGCVEEGHTWVRCLSQTMNISLCTLRLALGHLLHWCNLIKEVCKCVNLDCTSDLTLICQSKLLCRL